MKIVSYSFPQANTLDPLDPSKMPTAVQSAASNYALIVSNAFVNCEEYKSYGVTLFVKKDLPGSVAKHGALFEYAPVI